MSDKEFPEGLRVWPPHPHAPEYVKCTLSLHREELMQWLAGKSGEWIKLDVLQARSGKWYAAVNDWKPENKTVEATDKSNQEQAAQSTPSFQDDDIPF